MAIWAAGLGAVALVTLGMLLPTLIPPRGSAGAHCASRIRNLYLVAREYAAKHGHFPAAGGRRAHDALNDLLAEFPHDLVAGGFTCYSGEAERADPGPDGHLVLGPGTLDYAWIVASVSPHGPPLPLASDKYVDGYEDSEGTHCGHKNGMIVLFTDGTVRWVGKDRLPPASLLPEGLTR